MLTLLSKQKNYPLVACAAALIVSFVFTVIAPHEWASSPAAQWYIAEVATYVPALKRLQELLPPGGGYIALTGAAVWGLTPVYLVLVILLPLLDDSFLPDARRSANKLRLADRNSLFALAVLFAVGAVTANCAYWEVWQETRHFGPGPTLNMLSTFVPMQLVTWTFTGLCQYLFLSVTACLLLIAKYALSSARQAP